MDEGARLNTRLIALSSALLAATPPLAAYCTVIEPSWLSTTRLRVAVPGLPAQWDGLRVAHLSDFHAGGPRVQLPLLEQTKKIALAFQPDLIALTGDYYDNGSVAQVDDLYCDWPDQLPVVAVTGNHD